MKPTARILPIIVCPLCKAPLHRVGAELWCRAEKIAYPIQGKSLQLFVAAARPLSLEELEKQLLP